MLEKKVGIGLVTVLPDGQLQVREDTVILDNGQELHRTYHRSVLEPSETLPKQAFLKEIARVIWTPARIKARRAEVARRIAAAAGPPVKGTRKRR